MYRLVMENDHIETNKKMLTVAEFMFSDTIVSLGTRHLHTKHPKEADVTVLLGGRVEFNSYLHRRDMVDVLLEFNLYVKLLENGRYQCGQFNSFDFVVKDTPTTAVSDMAFWLVKTGESS